MKLFTISSHTPFSLSFSPWQPLIEYLSLCICLFWIFHIYIIMQYMAFLVFYLNLNLLFVRYIHVAACNSICFLFYGHVLFYCIDILPSFLFLLFNVKFFCEYSCTRFFLTYIFIFLWLEVMDDAVTLCFPL